VIVDKKGLEIANLWIRDSKKRFALPDSNWRPWDYGIALARPNHINMRPSPGGLVNNGLVKIAGAAHPRDNQLHQGSSIELTSK
jgi:hypothetical protein